MKRKITTITLSAALVICLAGGTLAFEGYRGSTWGELRYEIPREGAGENLLLDGWIRQGVDWAKWGNVTLNTYATLRYRWDTEHTDWHNMLGPGLGIALEAYSTKGAVVTIGAEYIWERFYEMDTDNEKVQIFMNWYGWWDLKKD